MSELPTCSGCGKEIDPDTCCCGGPINGSFCDNHSPVPMGCICGYLTGSLESWLGIDLLEAQP